MASTVVIEGALRHMHGTSGVSAVRSIMRTRDRWFELRGPRLLYWSEPPKAVIDLRGSWVVDDGSPTSWSLAGLDRPLVLTAPTPQEKQRWVAAISRAQADPESPRAQSGARAAHFDAAAPPVAQTGSLPSVGEAVETVGLSKAQLNGLRGRVKSHQGDRALVQLPEPYGEMSLGAANLKAARDLSEAPPRADSFGTCVSVAETAPGLPAELRGMIRQADELSRSFNKQLIDTLRMSVSAPRPSSPSHLHTELSPEDALSCSGDSVVVPPPGSAGPVLPPAAHSTPPPAQPRGRWLLQELTPPVRGLQPRAAPAGVLSPGTDAPLEVTAPSGTIPAAATPPPAAQGGGSPASPPSPSPGSSPASPASATAEPEAAAAVGAMPPQLPAAAAVVTPSPARQPSVGAEPRGWYSGTGGAVGVTVRVELNVSPGVLDVHQYGITDWAILGVPWRLGCGPARQHGMDFGPELLEGLKGTVVEGISADYQPEADVVQLVIDIRIGRWTPRISMRPALSKVAAPVGSK